MTPTYETNFCRVFELPHSFPEEFCFGGGHPVTMRMVDWFNPWPMDDGALRPISWLQVVELMLPWLREKIYVRPGRKYLLLTDFGEALVFEKLANEPGAGEKGES